MLSRKRLSEVAYQTVIVEGAIFFCSIYAIMLIQVTDLPRTKGFNVIKYKITDIYQENVNVKVSESEISTEKKEGY